MIVLNNPVTLFAKTVITDLAIRRGGPVDSAPSPYSGMRHVVDKYWHNPEEYLPIEELIAVQSDFDADKRQPEQDKEEYTDSNAEIEEPGTTYNPAVDDVNFTKYYRRLEDIHEKYIEKYIGNIVFRIRNHENGYHEYMYNNRFQQSLVNFAGEDDDEFTEVADLLIDEPQREWTLEERNEALQRMPYVMKRLYNLSLHCGVHMIGYLIAYLKARTIVEKKQDEGSVSKFKNNAVVSQGVYLMKPNGYIRPEVVEVKHKNEKARWAFAWVSGQTDEYQAYYKDCVDFIHYCNVLNIDVAREDVLQYDTQFVRKLTVVDVTPNTQYHKQVFDALMSGKKPCKKEETEQQDLIETTMDMYNQACETIETFIRVSAKHNEEKAQKNLALVRELISLYFDRVHRQLVNPSSLEWHNGFLHMNGSLVVLNSDFLCNTTFKDKRCIISELGYTIHVTDNAYVHYLTTAVIYDNIVEKFFNKGEYKIEEWRRLLI